MPDVMTIAAEAREGAGKGAVRALRRDGRMPGIIYGKTMETVNISIGDREFAQLFNDPGFFTHVFEIKVNGDAHQVLARDVQTHPVTDAPLHVDFLKFDETTRINVEVPCEFINEEESPGLKRGGVLNIVRREIELNCVPTNIPSSLIFDLTGLDIGDSIHISNIQLPQGVEPTVADRDFTVATIAAPTVLTAEEEAEDLEGEEGEEGEGLEGEEGEEGAGEEGGEDSSDGGEASEED